MKRLVIDVETTGLSASRHQILTVGMVVADVTPRSLVLSDERHILVRHDEYRVSRRALAVNGINLEEHHLHGVDSSIACERIHSFMRTHDLFDTPLLGHNIHFDLRFLRSLFQGTKQRYPFTSSHDDTRFVWQACKKQGLVNPALNGRLGTLAEHFSLSYDGAHTALGDCKITARVFHELLKLQSRTDALPKV